MSTSQDDFSLRLVEWLLDHFLQSPEGVATVSDQVATIISQTEQQSRELLHTHIARQIFRKATKDIIDPPINLCTQLCHSLVLNNVRYSLDHGVRITRIHQYVFNLCVDSVRANVPTNGAGAQESRRTASHASSTATQSTETSTSHSMGDAPLEHVSHLVAELYNLGLICIAHVYEYLSYLTTSSATIEARLAGLCTLFETRDLGPNIEPWKNSMGSFLRWAMGAIPEYPITEGTRHRVEAIANAQPHTLEPQDNENLGTKHNPSGQRTLPQPKSATDQAPSRARIHVHSSRTLPISITENSVIGPDEWTSNGDAGAKDLSHRLNENNRGGHPMGRAKDSSALEARDAGFGSPSTSPTLTRRMATDNHPLSQLGGSSQSQFVASNVHARAPRHLLGLIGRPAPMTQSASLDGFETPSQRVRGFEPVAPLERSENRWVAGSTLRTPQQVEERQLVERKVKALLNKLTMDKFDSISDQIIEYANKSEQEKDGSTLMQVIKLVFEKAKDEAAFSEMYARLCRKMMERVSPNVQDETIRNAEGQPIMGGMLFRKYLLNRCQEDFERGWSAKEAAVAAAASKAGDDKAAEATDKANGEAVRYSDEYYAAAKAKRQGLGLVRFISDLFKLQMLTERIMHECIKKLLSNVVNPEEEQIEGLCKLLTNVGQSLDNPKARNHMDIYFERMQEMAKGSNINSRMQFMLLDVIELRARHWQSRLALPQPAPSGQGQDKRDDRYGVQRGGPLRGERRDTTDPDGWNVASNPTRPPARAGDLSQFGKISKPTGIQFGPSSVFSKKDPKREASLSRTGGANIFSMLSAVEGTPAPERSSNSRKPIMDLGPGGSPAARSGERRKLNLAPRTKPTEEEAQSRAKENVKVYLGAKNMDETIMALEALPVEHRHFFVDKLVSAAFDGGNKVVVLAEKLFVAARDRQVISPDNFERGLLPTIEFAGDISIDVPKIYEWLTRFIIAAGFDKDKTRELAGKIQVEGEPRIHPGDILIREFEKASSA